MFQINVLLKITQVPRKKSATVDDTSKSERFIQLIKKKRVKSY
jgi:hypothetical protein